MTRDLLKTKLLNAGLFASKEAIDALDQGGSIELYSDYAAECAQLTDIYHFRANHLADYTKRNNSSHARHLAETTREFANNLSAYRHETGSFIVIRGDSVEEFDIFLLLSGEVIGCMKTVSQLRVSEEEWLKLWDVQA